MEMICVRYSHNHCAGSSTCMCVHASIECGSDAVGIFADCLALPAQL
jgi:hypothetical protein